LSKEVANTILNPISDLNRKMNTVIRKDLTEIQFQSNSASREIMKMLEIFREMLRQKRFMNNDFLQKSDSMAIIDLAEACNDFKKSNNMKAAGICFNNIGNFAYKSQKYD